MRPLEDVRVIALEQYGAGPFGSVHLADLGAQVIKIEDPRTRGPADPRTGGDVGRYVPPYASGEDSLFFETFNRNKQSLSLDISTPAGREVFEDLVRASDAVWSNLRGDVPAELGIRYADLAHLNRSVVCCSLTGFRMTGPRAAAPGYDYVLQGLAGWMSLTGDPDGPPTKTGLSLVDFSSGFVAALSLLAGLHSARRDGVGGDCDVSLYDTASALLTYPATWALNAGYEPVRTVDSAHPSLVPFRPSRPPTAGWSSAARRRSSGSGWSPSWNGPTWGTTNGSPPSPCATPIAPSSSRSSRRFSRPAPSRTGSGCCRRRACRRPRSTTSTRPSPTRTPRPAGCWWRPTTRTGAG